MIPPTPSTPPSGTNQHQSSQQQQPSPQQSPPPETRSSFLDRMKSRLSAKWTTDWAPLMRAKSNLDSDYNFTPGRHAGQQGGMFDESSLAPSSSLEPQRNSVELELEQNSDSLELAKKSLECKMKLGQVEEEDS